MTIRKRKLFLPADVRVAFVAATFCVLSIQHPVLGDPVQYSITKLEMPKDAPCEVVALNEAGAVAGKFNIGTGGLQAIRGFLWQNTKVTDLTVPHSQIDEVSAVNTSMQVVGIAQVSYSDQHAFLWENKTITDLGTLGGDMSFAYGLNSSGRVCGSSYMFPNRSTHHAFLWQRNSEGIGAMQDLGTLGGNNSAALAVNDAAQVAGFAHTKEGDYHAFLWQQGSMKDLGTLGGRYSTARGLNSQGQIIGNSLTIAGDQHAFVDTGGKMTDLFPFSSRYSDALGINTQGQVVGFAELPSGDYHAFLYSNRAIYDLNDLVLPGSGWVLQEARAINDAGQIAGVGSLNGQRHAFLLTPPAADKTRALILTYGGFRYNSGTQLYSQQVVVKNRGTEVLWGPFSLVLDNLSATSILANASGKTTVAAPVGSSYATAPVTGNCLAPGQSATVLLQFRNPINRPITYTARVMAGPGAL